MMYKCIYCVFEEFSGGRAEAPQGPGENQQRAGGGSETIPENHHGSGEWVWPEDQTDAGIIVLY